MSFRYFNAVWGLTDEDFLTPQEKAQRAELKSQRETITFTRDGEVKTVTRSKTVHKSVVPKLKLVLLALADRARDDGKDEGRCWCSVADIARRTGYERRQVLRILADLVERGLITRERQPGKPDRITLTIDIPEATDTAEKVKYAKPKEKRGKFDPSDDFTPHRESVTKIYETREASIPV